MTSRDELWRFVNRALDERRDPLSDEAVCAALEQRPEEAREVVALVAQLERLPSAAQDSSPRAPALARVLFAIAAGAALVLAYTSLRSDAEVASASPVDVAGAPEPAVALVARVLETLEYHSEFVVESPGQRTERVSDATGALVRFRRISGDDVHVFEVLHPNGTRP